MWAARGASGGSLMSRKTATRRGGGQDADRHDAGAPAEGLDRIGERRCGGEHAERADAEHERGEQREALGRIGAAEHEHRRHQHRRAADADERHRGHHGRKAVRRRKQQRAGDSPEHGAAERAPRPQAVERPADRKLGEREGAEPRRRQRAELGRAEAELPRQVRRHDRQERAVELAQDIGGAERGEGDHDEGLEPDAPA